MVFHLTGRLSQTLDFQVDLDLYELRFSRSLSVKLECYHSCVHSYELLLIASQISVGINQLCDKVISSYIGGQELKESNLLTGNPPVVVPTPLSPMTFAAVKLICSCEQVSAVCGVLNSSV